MIGGLQCESATLPRNEKNLSLYEYYLKSGGKLSKIQYDHRNICTLCLRTKIRIENMLNDAQCRDADQELLLSMKELIDQEGSLFSGKKEECSKCRALSESKERAIWLLEHLNNDKLDAISEWIPSLVSNT